jgi:hypothetical protein
MFRCILRMRVLILLIEFSGYFIQRALALAEARAPRPAS